MQRKFQNDFYNYHQTMIRIFEDDKNKNPFLMSVIHSLFF